MSLTRTRGTEAIKSPEVLEIKGSEVAEVKVTLASDIWSLGCLLYELVTQELLFQNGKAFVKASRCLGSRSLMFSCS